MEKTNGEDKAKVEKINGEKLYLMYYLAWILPGIGCSLTVLAWNKNINIIVASIQ